MGEELYRDLLEGIEALEKVAFSIPAPNPYTPQLIWTTRALRHRIYEAREAALPAPPETR